MNMEPATDADAAEMANQLADSTELKNELRSVVAERVMDYLYDAEINPSELSTEQEAVIINTIVENGVNDLANLSEDSF